MVLGKSTLIKIILGEDTNFEGEVKLAPSVKIGYIPQEIKFQNEEETILEYFMYDYNESETKARTYLAKYMFYGNNVFKRLKELSGGERVRLILAKLVLQETNFLILDEPTNHLDPETQKIIANTFKEYDGTLLLVSHNLEFVDNLNINRMLLLPSGQIKYYDKEIVKYYQEKNKQNYR